MNENVNIEQVRQCKYLEITIKGSLRKEMKINTSCEQKRVIFHNEQQLHKQE